MAQTSPKQNISFSIDDILSSGSGDENLQREEQRFSGHKPISSPIKTTMNREESHQRGDNIPDVRKLSEKQSGEFVCLSASMFKDWIIYS